MMKRIVRERLLTFCAFFQEFSVGNAEERSRAIYKYSH